MGSESIAPNGWMLLPFVALLLSLALGPLFFPNWWEKHYAKVVVLPAAITLGYYLLGLRAHGRVLQAGHEYISFIVLIGSLFVVSGGIHIKVRGEATPGRNTLFLLTGAVLANLLGTTGASILLIRPWIRMNKNRITAHQVVFFIFIVSNVGGCLTPVGDPPLFLGYLKGIPFWWVAEHCWKIWVVGVSFLLALFYAVDALNYRRAPEEVRARSAEAGDPWRFEGLWNIGFLLIILGAVFIEHPFFVRETLMTGAAAGSWITTKKPIHEANQFNFHPLKEVAILFAGIFATMLPALDWLELNAGQLGTPSPALFYWSSGILSSFLDNAPTYLSFFSATVGLLAGPHPGVEAAGGVLAGDKGFSGYIVAISIGAVFFGANTYIGNAPNFMVKSIAEQQKVRLPGFLGFIFKYTLPCMAPMLVLVWLLFFR